MRDHSGGWTETTGEIDSMDIRFAMVEMPMAQSIMEDQSEGWTQVSSKTHSGRFSLGRERSDVPQAAVPRRLAGWRALSGLVAMVHLWPARRPYEARRGPAGA